MRRRQEESLEGLYARIPTVTCKGLCQTSCGPIAMSLEEDRRLQAAGYRIPSMVDTVAAMEDGAEYWCPALQDGSCQVYEVRPAICRLWGATESMPCPHGCTPGDALSADESTAMLQASARAGGGAAARFFRAEGEGPEDAVLREPSRWSRWRHGPR